jgi:acyl dehydratase
MNETKIKSGGFFLPMLRNLFRTSMNRTMIGSSITQKNITIDSGETKTFAKATRDPNAGKRGYLPPMFIVKLFFPMTRSLIIRPELGVNLLRMVHGEIQIRWLRHLDMNAPIDLDVTVKEITETAAGELLVLAGKAVQSKKTAVEITSGILVRNRKKIRSGKSPEKKTKPAFELDIQTGKGQSIEYAHASGDLNFIHRNDLLAKMAGLPQKILHGMCLLTMCQNALVGKLAGGNQSRVVSIRGRFSHIIIPGHRLKCAVYRTRKKNEFTFEVFNPAGKAVIKNGAIVLR